MLIAKSKFESNIVEYLIYMYQIEDIIRSFQFDIEAIDKDIVQKYDQNLSVKEEIKAWYESLIWQMKDEQIEKRGHLLSLKIVAKELQVLHDKLITTIQDAKYISLYETAKPELKQLLLKTKGENFDNEIEIALHGLYGILLLRLKGYEISKDTETGVQKISFLMAYLAHQFKQDKSYGLHISQEQSN